MATITPKFLGQQVAGVAAASVVTAPANTTYIIKKVVVTNIDAASRTFTLYRVPSGGSTSNANTIYAAFTLSAGQTYDATACGNMVLGPGDGLFALASAAAVVNIFVWGLQQ